jgi:RIO-like serine/threonine protein kinase
MANIAKEDGFFAKMPSFTAGVGKFQQGVHELQENYDFNQNSKLVGAGSESSVFKCYNKANRKMIVAVKVINKQNAMTQNREVN